MLDRDAVRSRLFLSVRLREFREQSPPRRNGSSNFVQSPCTVDLPVRFPVAIQQSVLVVESLIPKQVLVSFGNPLCYRQSGVLLLGISELSSGHFQL